jgi:pimeloyl-ACP methyl ester carboxylesterase
MEAPSIDDLSDPSQRAFRSFAEATKSDLPALAACMRGARQPMTEAEARAIQIPVLVAAGTDDTIAGDASRLAALFPAGRALDIPGRDHNAAVGDKVFKAGVLEFLEDRR